MSARKKTSKSNSKKQEQSASKSKNSSLLASLKQKLKPDLEVPERDNLTAEVLEALLEKTTGKLDALLALWGHDCEAVGHVVSNLVESKIALFAQRIAELLQNDARKLYLYPWLEQLYILHSRKVPQEINEKIEKSCIVQAGETEEAMKLQGKLSLILQQ